MFLAAFDILGHVTLALAGLWVVASAAGGAREFTVAIDAGHGGTNLGAEGLRRGIYEKRVTLEIARRVRRRLAEQRNVRVVMCRDTDVLVPIRARVRCALDAGARLFVSIHANASPKGASRGTQRGFEIFVLPAAEVDRDASLAARSARNDVEAAWQAHRVRGSAAESLAAAERVRWQLADTLGADADRGIKQEGASLDVLQGLNMPAVLVEVGFLDHPEEGQLLASEAGWETIARALARAIGDLRAREIRGRTDPMITAGGGAGRGGQ